MYGEGCVSEAISKVKESRFSVNNKQLIALLWTMISFALSLAVALSFEFPQIIGQKFEPRQSPS